MDCSADGDGGSATREDQWATWGGPRDESPALHRRHQGARPRRGGARSIIRARKNEGPQHRPRVNDATRPAKHKVVSMLAPQWARAVPGAKRRFGLERGLLTTVPPIPTRRSQDMWPRPATRGTPPEIARRRRARHGGGPRHPRAEVARGWPSGCDATCQMVDSPRPHQEASTRHPRGMLECAQAHEGILDVTESRSFERPPRHPFSSVSAVDTLVVGNLVNGGMVRTGGLCLRGRTSPR